VAAPALAPLLSSLPIPRTRLIGRQTERASALVLLLDGAAPLLTLTGPGGVGKTRLAMILAQEAAKHFADGVVWVDLAPVGNPSLADSAIARALGLRDSGDQPIAAQLTRFLQQRQLLLVLDNFEHLLDGAPLLAALLARCPHLQILVTSRSVLGLSGEHQLPVPPLAARGGWDYRPESAGADQVAARSRHFRWCSARHGRWLGIPSTAPG
jgi:predicted ATPase